MPVPAMSDLSTLFREKLIPWAKKDAAQRFILARPKMEATMLPPDVQLVPYPIRGERTIVKNQRQYSNTRGISALWPEAGLNELRKFKIACVLEGHIDYQLGNYKLQCGPGHFIFIPPGIPHPDGGRCYIDTDKSSTGELIFFLLHPNALQCWTNRYDEPSWRQASKYLIPNERIVQLFHMLVEEITNAEAKSLALAEGLLAVSLLALQQEIDGGRLQAVRANAAQLTNEARHEHPATADFTTQLKAYIQTNLQKGLTMEDAARDMYLSRAQFARKVRRETGFTFNELLTQRRMEEAQKLLATSQWTVSTISYFLGFKSPSYFRTFFHKHAGQTPTEYRETALRKAKPKIEPFLNDLRR